MKSLFAVPALALLLGFAAVSQTPAAPKHHIVFQLSESDSAWSSLPIHVNNVIKALAEDGGSQIEVVFYGPGLTTLLSKTKLERVR